MTTQTAADPMKKQIEALRHDRALVVEQIRQSQETLTRSEQLLKRIDAVLSKVGAKSLDG